MGNTKRRRENSKDTANVRSTLKTEAKPQPSHPVDRGWSWIVMIAAFGVHFMSIGYQRSFGLLFVQFQNKYGSSSAVTSAISGTLLALNYLVKRIPIRTLCYIGCLLQTISIASSSVVPNSVYLIVTQGILYGCGHAFIYCPSLLILSQYFEKKRPIATTIATCGSSIGGIVFPMATRTFLDWYGLQGALLLLSGMMLQQLMFVTVYTPPSEYTKTVNAFDDEIDNSSFNEQTDNNEDYLPSPHKSSSSLTYTKLSPKSDDAERLLLGKNTKIDDVTVEQDENRNFDKKITQHDEDIPKDKANDLAYMSKSHDHIATGNRSPVLKRLLHQQTLSKSHHILPTQSRHRFHHRHHHYHPHHHQNANIAVKTMSGSSIEYINASMPSLLLDDLTTLNTRYHPHHSHHHLHHDCGDKHQHQHHSNSNSGNNKDSTINNNDDTNDNNNSKDHNREDKESEYSTKKSDRILDVESLVSQKSLKSCCRLPSVMKLPPFWLLAIFFASGAVGTGLPYVFLPPLAQERGLADEQGGFFLMTSSLIEIFGRLVPGLILHFNILRPSTCIVIPLTVCGLTYHLTPLFIDFESLLSFTLVIGLMGTAFWTLQTLVVIEVLGLEKLASAFGYYSIFMGVAVAASYPFGGWLRDVTCTYSSTYHYLGTCYFVAAAAVLVLLFRRKKAEIDDDEDDNDKEDVDDNERECADVDNGSLKLENETANR